MRQSINVFAPKSAGNIIDSLSATDFHPYRNASQ